RPSATRNEPVYSHFLNALVLEKRGEFAKALKEYSAVLDLEPSAASVYRQRADLHLRMGRPEKALTDMQRYVQQRPDDADSLSLLSSIHWILGQRTAARLALEKALDQDPYHPESLMTYANMVMNDDPQKAADAILKYLELDPESSEAYYNLGLAYSKLGLNDESQKMFKKVVELDSESLSSLLLLGQMKQKEGDLPASLGYLERALAIMPENFALRIQIIQLLALDGNIAKIETLLAPYKDRKDAPVETWLWLGVVYEQRKEWRLALDCYLKAKKQMNTVEINLRLASIYSELKQSANAIKSLEELTKSYPDNPQFHYFIALAHLDLRKPKKALVSLDKAIALKSDFSSAHFQKGVALDMLKIWPAAEKSFRDAVHADTTNASAYNYIGYSLAERNEQLFEARRMIERALELDPYNSAYLDS
ncbi:MAG: tetratricopeptide repeat protein, partial [Bdellovibrionota bacterium]